MGAIKKYRYVQTDLWEKSWFRQLGYKEKSLYLYFLTCPSSNVAGILELTDDRIKFDTGLTNIRNSMEKLKDFGEVYEIGSYIVVHRHPDFQKWEQKPNICKGIIAELESVPLEVFCEIRSRGYHFELLYDERSTKAFVDNRRKKGGQDYLPIKFIERCGYREIGKAFETLSNPFNYTESDTDTDIESDFDTESETEVYMTLTELSHGHADNEFARLLKNYEQLYLEKFGERHKAITEERAERAKDALQLNDVFTLDDEEQSDMIYEYFRTVKSDDYSLLHFATDGILDILNKRAM